PTARDHPAQQDRKDGLAASRHAVCTLHSLVQARTSTTDRLLPGSRIGDYKTIEELYVDDAGTVYLAAHVLLPRRVALKIMHSGSAWQRAVAMQLLREACLLEALSHPASRACSSA